MNFTKIIRRNFPGDKLNKGHSDYIGEGVTTKDCEMTTGYRGRGLMTLAHTFPAGTEVKFSLNQYPHWENYVQNGVKTVLEVKADFDGNTYSKSYRFLGTLQEAADILHLDENITKVANF